VLRAPSSRATPGPYLTRRCLERAIQPYESHIAATQREVKTVRRLRHPVDVGVACEKA